MKLISAAIIAFLVLEFLNILILYFAPGSKLGNGMGFFKGFEKAKKDPDNFAMLSYLVNWVAGTKLIFIALLIVILITGDDTTKIFSLVALILSIATFYWKLFPIIRSLDKRGQIDPKGYSRTLAIMITSFLAVFITVLVIFLLNP